MAKAINQNQLRAFYFPRWNRCARAHGWTMAEGRLQGARLDNFGGPEVNGLYQRVWSAALELSRQHCSAPTADDLRHGCTVVALGRHKSSKSFTQKELDRVTDLFALLTNPDDVGAMMRWNDPDIGSRKRLVWAIGHAAPAGYVTAIAADKFGTKVWEHLDNEQLRQLLMTLKERQRRWNQPRMNSGSDFEQKEEFVNG